MSPNVWDSTSSSSSMKGSFNFNLQAERSLSKVESNTGSGLKGEKQDSRSNSLNHDSVLLNNSLLVD